ncbi:MAG: DUF2007 domain-containing protein [Bacteroidota bacterium]
MDDWVCVFETGSDIEANMAKSYLNNLQIPSNILSKRDSAYSLNVGDMALIFLYVPNEYEKKAREALSNLDEDTQD